MLNSLLTTASVSRGQGWGFGKWEAEVITQLQSVVAWPKYQPSNVRGYDCSKRNVKM